MLQPPLWEPKEDPGPLISFHLQGPGAYSWPVMQ